jgi:hypothetical protein
MITKHLWVFMLAVFDIYMAVRALSRQMDQTAYATSNQAGHTICAIFCFSTPLFFEFIMQAVVFSSFEVSFASQVSHLVIGVLDQTSGYIVFRDSLDTWTDSQNCQ